MQFSISKIEHLSLSPGTHMSGKHSLGKAAQPPDPAHTPLSKSIFKSHFKDSEN